MIAGGAEKKTVLVWLHGGFFIGGEPTDLVYGPDFLISADNIFITVHYRLGIFGFLNLGFGEYTGNMGLKDQQLALEWIHENIENFSGNKNEVLLFGVSAGKIDSIYRNGTKKKSFSSIGKVAHPFTFTCSMRNRGNIFVEHFLVAEPHLAISHYRKTIT